MKRLFIISGKGGVGKTTFAMALAQKLKKQGRKSLYLSFDPDQYSKSLDELNIDYQKLSLEECAEDYINLKLKSRIIAKTVTKTPFFKAMLGMVPGFNNIIFFGKIRELLKEPDLFIILDAPATGHALTAFESLSTFKSIFNQGIVFDDIEKLFNTVFSRETLVIALSTPEKLVDLETKDFIQQLAEKNIPAKKIFNKAFSKSSELLKEGVPVILEKKVLQEKNVLTDSDSIIPFYFENDPQILINNITEDLIAEEF